MDKQVYEYIKKETANFRTLTIPVSENYEWNMSRHINTTILYKNSKYRTGNNSDIGLGEDRPFKNITRPILNLQYRAEGFDVKDIELFVNSPNNYYKSLLIRKFHDKWARENKIDTFIDEMVESYVDFGGALIKNVNKKAPQTVPMERIAFCDQTDILSGAICEKHNFSVDQIKDMEKSHWGDPKFGATISIDDLIVLARKEKVLHSLGSLGSGNGVAGRPVNTPSKYIEVFELHGNFPESWLTGEDSGNNKFVRQMHIVAFYQKEKSGSEMEGVTLFKGKEKEITYKLVLRDAIYNRALGFGGAEELFDPQVWVNSDMIRIKGMLDMASKIIIKTTDTGFNSRNQMNKVKNGQVVVYNNNSTVEQMQLTPTNITLFNNHTAEWEAQAQSMGAANDAILGKEPNSGTPFALQELVTQESHSLHEYRKGKLATFLDEVYKDWTIPHIVKEMVNDQEFIADLTLEEMQGIAFNISIQESNKAIKEAMFKGETITPAGVEIIKKETYDNFLRQGSKHFIKILKDELKDSPVSVFVNIVGKQKYMFERTQKLVNIFRQIIANPEVLNDPRMAKLFNQIIESSGLDPIDFGAMQPPRKEDEATATGTNKTAQVEEVAVEETLQR